LFQSELDRVREKRKGKTEGGFEEVERAFVDLINDNRDTEGDENLLFATTLFPYHGIILIFSHLVGCTWRGYYENYILSTDHHFGKY
jgi:hypothetical protein